MMENSFTLSFKRHFIHTPNTKQESIIKNLYQLTYGKESKQVYILTGYAGTGKTSILGAYVKTLTELKIKSRLLAPTGRAAKVLSNNSNKQAFTIHKQIYRRKNSIDDYNSLSLSQTYLKTQFSS